MMNRVEKIRGLEGKIVAACLAGGRNRRCPHAKQVGLRFECTVARCHCHSSKVRKYMAEIERLEKGV